VHKDVRVRPSVALALFRFITAIEIVVITL
jgi:hypothetical protein